MEHHDPDQKFEPLTEKRLCEGIDSRDFVESRDLSGMGAGYPADRIFCDGVIGPRCGALLFRWFWTVLVRGSRETFVARQPAAVAAAKTK